MSPGLGRTRVPGDGRNRHVGNGGVQHLHECRQRQCDRHDDELRAFQRFCCCITRTSGLTRVSLYDVVDQFIDRREINFACVTFGNRRRSYLAGQYLTVAISGIHGDQRR